MRFPDSFLPVVFTRHPLQASMFSMHRPSSFWLFATGHLQIPVIPRQKIEKNGVVWFLCLMAEHCRRCYTAVCWFLCHPYHYTIYDGGFSVEFTPFLHSGHDSVNTLGSPSPKVTAPCHLFLPLTAQLSFSGGASDGPILDKGRARRYHLVLTQHR